MTDDRGEVDQDEVREIDHETRHGVPVTYSRGQAVLHPSRERYHEVIAAVRDEGFLFCADLCGVDYFSYNAPRGLPEGVDAERFEVVVNLISHGSHERVRVRVQVPANDPVLPTLFRLFPGTENMEREVYDLFGIGFEGHPDLTRILMPDEWEGHPLRKDFAVGRIPVQFKGAPSAR